MPKLDNKTLSIELNAFRNPSTEKVVRGKRTFLIFTASDLLECVVTTNTTPKKCTASIQCNHRNRYKEFDYCLNTTLNRRDDDTDEMIEWHTIQRLLVIINPVSVSLTHFNNHGMKHGTPWYDSLGSGYYREIII